jgi:hypothetical protein
MCLASVLKREASADWSEAEMADQQEPAIRPTLETDAPKAMGTKAFRDELRYRKGLGASQGKREKAAMTARNQGSPATLRDRDGFVFRSDLRRHDNVCSFGPLGQGYRFAGRTAAMAHGIAKHLDARTSQDEHPVCLGNPDLVEQGRLLLREAQLTRYRL